MQPDFVLSIHVLEAQRLETAASEPGSLYLRARRTSRNLAFGLFPVLDQLVMIVSRGGCVVVGGVPVDSRCDRQRWVNICVAPATAVHLR